MSWGQKKIHPQKAGGSQRGLERRSRKKGVVIKFIDILLKNAFFSTSFQREGIEHRIHLCKMTKEGEFEYVFST